MFTDPNPLAPSAAQFPLNAPGARQVPAALPDAVSFGFGRMRRTPAVNTVDLTGVVYDPVRQCSTLGGRPLGALQALATTYNTVEDGQTWADRD